MQKSSYFQHVKCIQKVQMAMIFMEHEALKNMH
jgi:hypothetical protein